MRTGQQAPIVNLADLGMATPALFAQHCDGAEDYARQSQRNMDAHDH